MSLPATPSFRLDGRRALITGASSGIGLAAAAALVEYGAHVTLAARTREKLEAAADELSGTGGTVDSLALDVTDLDAVEREIAAAGPFDILVNNAGAARPKAMLDMAAADYDHVMDVNVRAAYFVAKAVAKGLVETGKPGSIINISSQMGHVGGPDRTVYAASKHAIEGLTKSMALEFAPHGIRVNTLCPTFIRTPLTEPTFNDPERAAWVAAKIPLGRVGEVEDMMGPIVFLASDASALMTGASLIVDGGWTAG
ncbi:MAG: SDR family oxidoreductase [Rhizobiaceae bacterium]